MTFGRLLIAGLLVTPLVSFGGTFVLLAADAATSSSPVSQNNFMFGLILLSIFAFLVVALAVFLIGIPLALILQRLRIPALLRDVVFLAIGAAAIWSMRVNANPDDVTAGFFQGIVGGTVLVWIIAMHLAARGKRPVEQVNV
jgi:hypothetical protein